MPSIPPTQSLSGVVKTTQANQPDGYLALDANGKPPDNAIFIHQSLTQTASTGFATPWQVMTNTNTVAANVIRGLDSYLLQHSTNYVLDNLNGTNLTIYTVSKTLSSTSAAHALINVRNGVVVLAIAPMSNVILPGGEAEVDSFSMIGECWAIDGGNRATTGLRLNNVQFSRFSGATFCNSTNGLVLSFVNIGVFDRMTTDIACLPGPSGGYTGVSRVTFGLDLSAAVVPSQGNEIDGVYTCTFNDCSITHCGLTGVTIEGSLGVTFNGGFINQNGHLATDTNTADVVIKTYLDAGGNPIQTSECVLDGVDIENAGTNYAVIVQPNSGTRLSFKNIVASGTPNYSNNTSVFIGAGNTAITFDGGWWDGHVDDYGDYNNYINGVKFTGGVRGPGLGTAKLDYYYASTLTRVRSSGSIKGLSVANNPSVLLGCYDQSGTTITNLGSMGGFGTATASNVIGSSSIMASEGNRSLNFDGTQTASLPSAWFEGLDSAGSFMIVAVFQASAPPGGGGAYLMIRDDVGSHRQIQFVIANTGQAQCALFDSAGTLCAINFNGGLSAAGGGRVCDGQPHVLMLWWDQSQGKFFAQTDGDFANTTSVTATGGATGLKNFTGINCTMGYSGLVGKIDKFQIVRGVIPSGAWIANFVSAVRKGT